MRALMHQPSVFVVFLYKCNLVRHVVDGDEYSSMLLYVKQVNTWSKLDDHSYLSTSSCYVQKCNVS